MEMPNNVNGMGQSVEKKRLLKAGFIVLCLLAAFLAVEAISTLKGLEYIGRGAYATNVITVSGKGEAVAVPDTATFYFSVVENAKTVAEAQEKAAQKNNAAITAIKAMGIADKDIQTTGYNVNPTYEYSNYVCTNGYCPQGKQTLTGYEVSQTITVKVRKTADAGAVLTKVGGLGVSNISGLNFVIDDMDAVQADARDKAIADAKAKAKVLAKSLGVSLSKIVNFDEGGGGPIYYGMANQSKAMDAGMATPPTVPDLPTGENKITSNVTITYEIR